MSNKTRSRGAYLERLFLSAQHRQVVFPEESQLAAYADKHLPLGKERRPPVSEEGAGHRPGRVCFPLLDYFLQASILGLKTLQGRAEDMRPFSLLRVKESAGLGMSSRAFQQEAKIPPSLLLPGGFGVCVSRLLS